MVYADNNNMNEYENIVLSAQNVFWVKRDGSRVLVCRAGDLLANARLERFPKLESEQIISVKKLQEVSNIFSSLESATRPREKMKIVKTIRENWTLWFNSHESLSALEIILLSEYLMPKQLKENSSEWSEASLHLFQRSCFISTLFTLGTCALGYHSWKFLRDAWAISFCLSSHYSKEGMKASDMKALGDGEVDQNFVEKMIESVDLKFVGLKQVAARMFERQSASATPYGLKTEELSDIERLFAHLESKVSYLTDFQDYELKKIWRDDQFKIVHKLYDNNGSDFAVVEDVYLEFGL
ncbi:MAG: hypothetical protein CME71_04735 [Halobacteriovorax sp.]|nr:hypothetical protein [Halobacteriovorax sp.]|tara:strand:+ start:286 stop:1176 length:891 start_codon:yes stop_codon:yes gene_type:complete